MCVVTFDWSENDANEKFKRHARTRKLSWAVVEVTDHCNFNCKWCFANATSNKHPKHMPLEEYREIVSRLSEAGLLQITLSGGEPTLYPHLKQAVRIAREAGLIVHMNTNGYLLDGKLAGELCEEGLSQVQINIDSIRPHKHDGTRGMRGSFGRALSALENARKAGMTAVSQTVVTRENEGEVVDIFRLARSLGLQRCRVWDMTPSKGVAVANSHLLPSDYTGLLSKLAVFAKMNGAKHVESGDPLFTPDMGVVLDYTGGFCVAGRGLYTTISVDGDVLFCATLRRVLYNVLREPFSDLNGLHKAKVEAFLDGLRKPGACVACPNSGTCVVGCYTRMMYPEDGFDYMCKMPGALAKRPAGAPTITV